ncbi:hypothetical protein MT378_07020 [Psychrobacter sp. 16-Bac2893]|jgi:hypothetical protein|tara:strand:- start:487 stop:1608 length:1122 start_codon:yes stop_codon:yes gene_type:complete
MRKLEPPLEFYSINVYKYCIYSIGSQKVELRNRLVAIISDMERAALEYESNFTTNTLYTIAPNNSKKKDIFFDGVTKEELLDVYNKQLVPPGKKARTYIYDKIIGTHLFFDCPSCGFGEVENLDHYLSKSHFPQFVVHPLNLIPSCGPCNKKKGHRIATTAEMQVLNPYIDHGIFITDRWLFARVDDLSQFRFAYSVRFPLNWDDVSKSRVKNHFETFTLSSRYSKKAGIKYVELKDSMDKHLPSHSYTEIIEKLKSQMKDECHIKHVNSWLRAFYEALIEFYESKITQHSCISSGIQFCRRCRGSGMLLGSSCNICYGAGGLSGTRLDELSHIIDEPISCTKCMLGESSCIFCRGRGSIPIEEYWSRGLDLQ